MNGTQLLRRSVSIVVAISSLAVAGCGVELNGLFTGDGGAEDVSQGDVKNDARVDVVSEARGDATVDGGVADSVIDDGRRADIMVDAGRANDARSDAGGDPVDSAAMDARIDTSADANADANADADARRDGDDIRDVANETALDAGTEDTPAEPRIDATTEPPIDVAADVTDASNDGEGGAPPGTCSGACNTFANISPTITRTVEQGATPTMTGGNIVDGTYVLVDVVHYNGDMSMYSLSETSVIAGDIDAWVSSINGQAAVRYTTTFSTSTNQMAFTFCCPTAGALTILYSTDGTKLSHIDPANPNRVITYTRQ